MGGNPSADGEICSMRRGCRLKAHPPVPRVHCCARPAPQRRAGFSCGSEPCSSSVVARVLADLRRLGNRETPAVLSVLVIEDFAMAADLPLLAILRRSLAAGRARRTHRGLRRPGGVRRLLPMGAPPRPAPRAPLRRTAHAPRPGPDPGRCRAGRTRTCFRGGRGLPHRPHPHQSDRRPQPCRARPAQRPFRRRLLHRSRLARLAGSPTTGEAARQTTAGW